MAPLSLAAWALAALAGFLPVPAARAVEPGPLHGIDDYIARAMKDWEVPGLAVAVVKDDAVVLAKGYGVRRLGGPTPVDERTLFAVGSTTKAFTAAALAMLVDEGKLKWDDPVTRYLPSFQLYDPYVTREMTVRDLLCHRSGLDRTDLIWYGSSAGRDEVIRRVRYVKPSTSFRGRYGYQNIMFVAAGQVIPAVTGKSWDDFVKERIFKPLGMTASNTSITAFRPGDDVATPHDSIEGKVRIIPWRNVDNLGPAGSINSNVADMAQWVRLQLNEGACGKGRLLSTGAVRETHTPQTVIRVEGQTAELHPLTHLMAYGLGWTLQDYRGRKVVQHGGGIDGMVAQVGLLPEDRLGVVVLSNLSGTLLPQALVYRVFDAYRKGPARDWSADYLKLIKANDELGKDAEKKQEAERVKGTRPSLPPQKYAGVYRDDAFGEMKIMLEKGKLVVSFGPLLGDLEHWHFDTFRLTSRDPTRSKVMMTFSLNRRGEVEEVQRGEDQGREGYNQRPRQNHGSPGERGADIHV